MKPPYVVPTMAEINALDWNGYNVVSTFSGGGGSCTGYRMAGYRVLYANEFIPAAQATYKANHHASHLDGRDIRTVTADEILSIIGLKPGELDLFDGSPPCSAFSTAGKRDKGWGIKKAYSDDAQQVVDDLFFEYCRLLKGLQPKVFVAENVSGLVKGSAKGYFKLILQALKDCGYNVKAQVLNAAWLGVPQARERLIFVGVRSDLGRDPVFPKPFPHCYTVGEATQGVVADQSKPLGGDLLDFYHQQRIGESRFNAAKRLGLKKGGMQKTRVDPSKPAPTITTTPHDAWHWAEPRTLAVSELKRIASFPDDYTLAGTFEQKVERIGRSVPPLMMRAISATIRDEILAKL